MEVEPEVVPVDSLCMLGLLINPIYLLAVIRNQVHDQKSAAMSRMKRGKQQLDLLHQLSSIDTIVNFWSPPKSQGGIYGKNILVGTTRAYVLITYKSRPH